MADCFALSQTGVKRQYKLKDNKTTAMKITSTCICGVGTDPLKVAWRRIKQTNKQLEQD